MKKTISLFVSFILLISLVLTACSGSGEEASGDEVTISFWNRFPEVKDHLEDMIDDFEEENPDIKVDMQYTPASSYQEQYETAIANDELPDVYTNGGAPLEELVRLDKAHKLDDVITEEDEEEFDEGVWGEGKSTIDDDKYVLPWYSPNHSGIVLFYNEDVLDEFGYDEDDVPQSWDELKEVGQDIYNQSDGDVYGLVESEEDWVYGGIIREMSRAINPEIISDRDYKEGEPSYDHDGYTESVKYLKDLLDNDVLMPRSLEVGKDEAHALFTEGQAAFYLQGPSMSSVFVDEYDFEDWGMSEVPTKNGDPTYRVTGESINGVLANENTEHWDEVKTFLEYMIDNVYSDVVVKAGVDPAIKDVDESEAPFSQFGDMVELSEEQGVTVPQPAEIDIDAQNFLEDYASKLSEDEVGSPAVGYMTGEVKDIDEELQKMDQEAKETFDETLEDYPDISEDMFKFPNWEPFEPFEDEDYEDSDD